VIVSRDADTAIVRLEGMYSFIDAWHVGIVEGAMRAIGRHAHVQVRMRSPVSADFLIAW
jgi:uncharacterized protein (TIGR02265 family)